MIRQWLLMLAMGASFLASLPSERARASGECPSSGLARPGTSIQHIVSGGLERSYLLHVPSGYDSSQPVPLVVSLHGLASNAIQQAVYSRWNDVAERANIITVYPQGTGRPPRWNSGGSRLGGDNGVDDVQFMRGLLANLAKRLCIDPARIYVNGISNGGGMSYRIACEMADQVAAIGTVAGAFYEFPGGCHPSRPVPVIAFHGTADPLVNFDGNPRLGLPKITTWAADWAARNGCTTSEAIPAKGEVSGIRYTGCKGHADVVLYRIEGGGHTWPGSPIPVLILGKTTRDINATETMWTFFEQHPLN
jgi:polyhydroxybutyrate depolymerase